MLELFKNTDPIDLNLPEASVWYYPDYFNSIESNTYFETLLTETQWQQDDIRVYGKIHPQPRLTHLFANNDAPYSYSNITMYPSVFPEVLLNIKTKAEQVLNVKFSTCLANLYRDGNDSNGWHADNEKELGPNPIIASVSLGGERWFHLKHKTNKQIKRKILLESGSLLVMGKGTQENYLHQIPKTKKVVAPRINLTFRRVFEK